MISLNKKIITDETGYSILEFIVAAAASAVLALATITAFSYQMRESHDNTQIVVTEGDANFLQQLLRSELRTLGSGMPLGQTGFAPGGTGLSDAPMPILAGATSNSITFRTNVTGLETMLAADYTPAPGSLTFSVASADGFYVGDTIYISDAHIGGTSGLQGEITGVGSSSISIASSFIATTSATFLEGSVVAPVRTIIYSLSITPPGVSRDEGFGALIIVPNSTLALQYFDANGNTLATPLTQSDITNNLTSVQLTVTLTPDSALANHGSYTAQLSERITLRNLLLGRQ